MEKNVIKIILHYAIIKKVRIVQKVLMELLYKQDHIVLHKIILNVIRIMVLYAITLQQLSLGAIF